MKRDIQLKWHYDFPAQVIWECLTDAKLLGSWLMENDFKPIVGHRFKFKSKPVPAFGWDGIVYCTVTEMVPLRRISFSWKSGSEERAILDTTVTWILNESADGTELILEHKGFTGWKASLISIMMQSGWKKMAKGKLLLAIKKHAVHEI